ncbi:hypothetical protein BKA56DRAFT_581262 [Ilyonectria sp. MPI-CAGE-AT-0026]|nr:hypothetical protein BKA56DRAFT_581262 [Ilyonectria sp. MPI-CAGE-AT-0026]
MGESIAIPNLEALWSIPSPLDSEAHQSENPRHSHSDTHLTHPPDRVNSLLRRKGGEEQRR